MLAIVKECLIYYDGPQLVSAVTEDGSWCIAVAYEEDFQAMVAVVSDETMQGVLDNKIDLHDVFTTLRIGPAYTSTIAWVHEPMILTPLEGEPPNEWLPMPDCKLRP